MHWMKLDRNRCKVTHINLEGAYAFFSDNLLILTYASGSTVIIDEKDEQEMVLARLDALAEIATARTAAVLPILEAED